MRPQGRIFSPCIPVGLWTGFGRVHGKESALSFYASDMESGDVAKSAKCVATESLPSLQHRQADGYRTQKAE